MAQYRLVVGEVGNERGHIVPTAAQSDRGARIALGRAMAVYGRDGWGRIEMRIETERGADWVEVD